VRQISAVNRISRRARRDSRALGKPLVFLQAADEVSTITDNEVFARMLNVVNIHKTGHMHGVFPAHEGMRVRLTQKYNATAGLVQEQKGTIICFVFNEEDSGQYAATGAGEMFRPRCLPAGIWLQLDDFSSSPIHGDVRGLLTGDEAEKQAKGLFFLPVMEDTFSWRSSENHAITRYGFTLTHANYLTSTAAQGFTIRLGVAIDCARLPPQGLQGLHDDFWWFHLYVMFSRATRMQDMLLLRPPTKEFLERGPPGHIVRALAKFETKRLNTEREAIRQAAHLGFELPA
jgi:hypothetical protein